LLHARLVSNRVSKRARLGQDRFRSFLEHTDMAFFLHRETIAGLRQRRLPSRQALIASIAVRMRAYFKRQRERQELLEYIASDHRAANDLGINMDTARDWSRRPFWRA
jgi:uncharacterized protein YjiS (DUF1127 family)